MHEDGSTALRSAAHGGCRCRCRGPRDFALMGLLLGCRSRLVLVLICIDVEVSYPRGRVIGAEILLGAIWLALPEKLSL